MNTTAKAAVASTIAKIAGMNSFMNTRSLVAIAGSALNRNGVTGGGGKNRRLSSLTYTYAKEEHR